MAEAMQDDHPVTVGVAAAFLRSGRSLDHASSVFLLGAFILPLGPLSLPGAAAVGAAILLALAEKYYAWRVALDAELFALLAGQADDMEAFDAALAAFLGRASMPAGRSMQSRWQGARRLLKCQAALLGLQIAATLCAVLV